MRFGVNVVVARRGRHGWQGLIRQVSASDGGFGFGTQLSRNKAPGHLARRKSRAIRGEPEAFLMQ